MTAEPRVSIAMATYNGARFIREQLDSFATQTRLPDELVVTDDGSTDETIGIVESFAEKAVFPIQVHRNVERVGYSKNFENAMSLTTGDVIFISDQDDVWYSDKIARACAVLTANRHVLATVNDQLIVDADSRSSGNTIFGNARRAGMPNTYLIAGSCTAISRRLLPILLPFPDGIPYDSWIGCVADTLRAKQLIEEPLQIYRRHDGNTTQPLVVGSSHQWSDVCKYELSDPRGGWTNEVCWRHELIGRLEQHRSSFELLVPSEIVSEAIASNERRIAALGQRLKLLARPRWLRGGAILRAWRSGIYREFRGNASALKDLVRP
jgi:glycosyltransferase involved in cell wall biosynthesis